MIMETNTLSKVISVVELAIKKLHKQSRYYGLLIYVPKYLFDMMENDFRELMPAHIEKSGQMTLFGCKIMYNYQDNIVVSHPDIHKIEAIIIEISEL
jgi:hypothetical protein